MTPREAARRVLVPVTVLILALLAHDTLPAAAQSAPPRERKKIVVNTSGNSLLYTNLYIAKFKGYFEQEGLDADLIELAGAPQATQAVLTGSTLLAVTPINATIDAVLKNQPVVVVAAGVNQNANILVVSKEWARKANITSRTPLAERIKALKGARIGVVGPRAANDDLTRFLLVTYGGLSPEKDTEIVNLGGSLNYPPALEKNRVHAFMGASPAAETSIARGHGIALVNPMAGEIPELRGQLFVAAVVRRDSLDKRRDEVAAAVRALARAQKLIAVQPDEVKRVLREQRFSNIPPEVWDLAWANNLPGLARGPVVDPAGYRINFLLMNKARSEPVPDVPFERVVTNELAEAAVKAIGR